MLAVDVRRNALHLAPRRGSRSPVGGCNTHFRSPAGSRRAHADLSIGRSSSSHAGGNQVMQATQTGRPVAYGCTARCVLMFAQSLHAFASIHITET